MSICVDLGVLLQHAWILFFSTSFSHLVRVTRIAITLQIVADVLRVPKVEFPDYPKMSSNMLFMSALLIGVSVNSLTVWAVRKALSF